MFHHTRIEGLLGMLKYGRLRLSRADAMNDGTEKFPGADRTFVFSLSAAPTESPAMWTVYGRTRNEAIRLRFSRSKILALFKGGKLNAYPVVGGHVQEDHCVAAEAKLSYVCYLSGNKENLVHFSNGEICIMSDGMGNFQKNIKLLPGVSKYLGWRDEREARLIVTLPEGVKADKIEIEATDVLAEMLEYGKEGDKNHPPVVTGPWMERESLIGRLRVCVNDEECHGDLVEAVRDFIRRAAGVSDEFNPIMESLFKGNLRIGPCDCCAKCDTHCDMCKGSK